MRRISPQSGSGQAASVPPRLVKAAHEFEAQMMQELLKPLTAGAALTGDDDGGGAGSGNALSAFAAEALGQGLSERGGWGIAASILGHFSHSGNAAPTRKVTTNQHLDTGMRGRK